MTFASAPWALDGARTASALARTASYAETGSAEGVISRDDLKVSPLDVPGVGVKIAAGGALILNRYQTTPSQTYTVLNVGDEILDPTDMPPANAAQKVYLVCATVGDPEFSQTGHPWMTSSDPAAGTEETFQYVRPFIIPVANTSIKTAKAAGVTYPALALAQLVIPANTTTITSSMITDVRKIARPRNSEEIFTGASSSSNYLNGGAAGPGNYEVWPSALTFQVDIPEWATTAKVMSFVEGPQLQKAGIGALRVTLVGAGSTAATNLNESAPTSGVDRKSYNVGGKIDIPANLRGTTATIRMEGMVANTGSQGFLIADTYTGGVLRVRFEEAAI